MSDIIFADDVQENEERVGGGGFTADDSNITLVALTECFLTESAKGAVAANIRTKDKEGNERAYQVYFTNRNKETFYVDKKTQNKVKLPGYQLLDSLALATTGKPFADAIRSAKKKVIDLYDMESRKEVPTEVKALTSLCKKGVYFGVVKVIKNKYKTGKPTAEKAEANQLEIVFRKEDKLTPKEHAAGKTTHDLYDKWYAYWVEPNRVKDEYKEVEEEPAESGANPFGDTADDADLFGETETTEETTTEESPAKEPSVSEEEDDPFA